MVIMIMMILMIVVAIDADHICSTSVGAPAVNGVDGSD